MIDKVEKMTIENLPSPSTPEEHAQLSILKQLACMPDNFRICFFHLQADKRLHGKHALLNLWHGKYDVLCVNMAGFIRKLVQAIHKGTWLADMDRYQEPEILLVDDWHLITAKDSTMETFYSLILKPRLEKKLLTVIFSEQGYTELSPILRDDLRNLLRLGLQDLDWTQKETK